MAGGGEVDISQLVPVEDFMSADVAEVKDGKGEAGEATHVHFVGGKSGGCANGVFVRTLDVREFNNPVSLLFVADHG